eukprot:1372784-Pyramimonas_sp.AAC.1
MVLQGRVWRQLGDSLLEILCDLAALMVLLDLFHTIGRVLDHMGDSEGAVLLHRGDDRRGPLPSHDVQGLPGRGRAASGGDDDD